jgi:hypothetical protein
MKAQCTTGRRRICKLSGVEKQEPPTENQGLCGTPASAAEGHQAQATGCERSRPRSWPGLTAAAAWLTTRHSSAVGGRLAGNGPIHALTVGLLGLQLAPELLAHYHGQEAAHRVRLPDLKYMVRARIPEFESST